MNSRRKVESQKKVDTLTNGDVQKGYARLQKEKNYLPLQIKKGLIILVPKEKHNEKYRKEYLKKISSVNDDTLIGV